MTLALLTDPWTYLEYALICVVPMLVLAGCASCVLLQDSLRRARRKERPRTSSAKVGEIAPRVSHRGVASAAVAETRRSSVVRPR